MKMRARKLCVATLMLLTAVAICSSAKAYAAEEEVILYNETISEDEREKDFERQIQAGIEEKLAKEPQTYDNNRNYTYETEYVGMQMVDIDGEVGNQLDGGVRFGSGGGFYWTPGGGPTITTTVSFSYPIKDKVTVSFDLGMVCPRGVVSGYFVQVPDTLKYYKLAVVEKHEVRLYNTYKIDRRTGEKTLWLQQHPTSLYNRHFECREVGSVE